MWHIVVATLVAHLPNLTDDGVELEPVLMIDCVLHRCITITTLAKTKDDKLFCSRL